jgi:hypothetical protein
MKTQKLLTLNTPSAGSKLAEYIDPAVDSTGRLRRQHMKIFCDRHVTIVVEGVSGQAESTNNLERWNTNNAKNGQIDVGGVFIVTSERQYR